MIKTRTSIDQSVAQDSAVLFVFRRFVNNASPQDLVDFYSLYKKEYEERLAKNGMFYIENLYTLDGDQFTVRDEQFIETFARLALANEDTWDLPFVIMAFAPTAPSWSGDMLDWLKVQGYEVVSLVARIVLTMGMEQDEVGNSAMVALLERYAEYDAMRVIANRIFEHRHLAVFERLWLFSDEEALAQLNTIGLHSLHKHTTVADWLARTRSDFSGYPYPIVEKVVERYTALHNQAQAV